MIDDAAERNSGVVTNVSYELKKMDAAKTRAILDGYRRAHDEANALANAAGRRLGQLTYASVDVTVPTPIRGMTTMETTGNYAAMAPPTTGFGPEQMTITARVHAIFRFAQ